MKYNTLQLRYIQRKEKAFDMCPEVRLIQAKRLVIFTTMFYITNKDPTITFVIQM